MSTRYEYETLKVENTTIVEINGHEPSGPTTALHAYLTERSQDGWEVEGMGGAGPGLLYVVVLKKKAKKRKEQAGLPPLAPTTAKTGPAEA